MSRKRRKPEPPTAPPRQPLAGLAITALLIVATVAAYVGSFSGPFIFDDIESIPGNPSIRSLTTALHPPAGTGFTVDGRPLLNLSFAANHAWGGIDPRGYHITNLILHLVAGLLLFSLVRHTLRQPRLRKRFASHADLVAGAVALLWLLHPLQTESVTYVVQRAETLAAVFILLTLVAFVRGTQKTNRATTAWFTVAVAASAAGMATKEIAAAAPLLVLLYDRTFVAGSFSAAWKQRRWLYLALAATWGILAVLVIASAGRGGSAGFGAGVSSWHYALTQCRAIVLYLQLCFWPHPLVLDRGTTVVNAWLPVLPQAVLLAALIGATIWALVRRPVLGYAGTWFFLILAPTSSVVPVATQTIAEHRMYLPLAAVIALVVAGLHRALPRARQWLLAVGAITAAVFGVLTFLRNQDYRTAESIWRDTVARQPDNPRAHLALGNTLAAAARADEALASFDCGLALAPADARLLGARGNALLALGRTAEAIAAFEAARQHAPDDARLLSNLGNALLSAGRVDEAIEQQRAALRFAPDSNEARRNLAIALARGGRTDEAIAELQTVLQRDPDDAKARLTLANTFALARRPDDAIREYRQLLQRHPDTLTAWSNLGFLLVQTSRRSEAVSCYEGMLRRFPGNDEARTMLARLR